MKLSTSTTRRPPPGAPPAAQARLSASPSTRSSWRTCPKVNARKNVPSVDGAATRWPSTAPMRPERTMSQSSIESAPSSIAEINVITFEPALAAPARCPRRTHRSTRRSIPSRTASVATSTTPASATARRSSKRTSIPSNPTGPSSCTMKVTS
jgi:hypothetical protein